MQGCTQHRHLLCPTHSLYPHAQAAASVELQRFDAVRDTNESLQGVLSLLETRLADRWQEELTTQLAAALRAKQQCAAEAREYRLQRAAARLRAQLRALQGGGGGGFPAPLTPDERWVGLVL